MTHILTSHLLELVENLHDLRLRLRHTARVEVARAIGEALRETTMHLLCGAARYQPATSASYPAWDDPWQDSPADTWGSANTFPQEMEADPEEDESPQSWHAAVLAGLATARWGFVRCRQVGPALLLGLVVALAASVAGPTLQALLEAWLATQDLLTFPGRKRMP